MRLSTFLVEFWALIALSLPLTAASIVLGLHLAGWHGSEQLVEDIAEHNNAVVVLVQVLSQILGFILIFALCTVIKIYLRSWISKKPISLERARFLNAISQVKVLIAERHVFTVATILFALLSYIPGAIWAGAISPRVVLRTINRDVQVPYYPDDYAPSGRVNPFLYNSVVQNDKGLFTLDPNRFSGQLLNSARQASNRHVLRAKLDDTGYSFFGRSFGAGSGVGLDPSPANDKSLKYSFNQTSIVANARCYRNTSSTFGIANYTSIDATGPAFLAYTTGKYPNGTAVASMWLYTALWESLFAMDFNHLLQSRRAHVFIASTSSTTGGLSEATYNQTYCEVDFAAHEVQVHVNTTARTIITNKLDEVAWPAYADNATAQALVALRALTVKDNGVGESEVWRAMQSNTETLYYNTYGEFPVVAVDDALLFQSIADFITDVLDNNMLMDGACQQVFNQSTQSAHSDVQVLSVVFGHAEYQYTIFGLTLLTVVICVGYLVVTVGGNGQQLDLADFANVALNASKGGTSLFDNYETKDSYDAIRVISRETSDPWPGIAYARDEGSTKEVPNESRELLEPARPIGPED